MYCAECDRIEDDEIALDFERCSICNGILCVAEIDDGQPDEQQEWSNYDRDC